MNSKALLDKYNEILHEAWKDGIRPSNVRLKLNKLRRMILMDGLPDESSSSSSSSTPVTDIATSSSSSSSITQCTFRGQMWKLLLQVPCYNPDDYLRLVTSGNSSVDEKIRNDTFRTLGKEPLNP